MTKTTKSALKEQLAAQVEFVEHRLDSYRQHLAEATVTSQEAFEKRAERIAERCAELSAHMKEWPEVEVGTATAVEDLGSAVDTLEADLEAARDHDAPGYRRALDRQVRAWRSRADHLRLQSALGSMELRDELEEVGHRLNAARGGVLVELRNAAHDSRGMVVDLRDDVEDVLDDVRHAVERFAEGLTESRRD